MAGLDGFGIAIAAFLVLSLVVGTLTSRLVKKSSKRYMVAGKSLPLFFVGTMLAAQSIDGNSSLGNVSLVYQFGFWAGAAIPIGLGVCLILTGTVYGKRLNKMALLTLPDFYYRRFGNGAEGISGVLMMISFIVLVAGNFAASGFILQSVFGIDLFWGMLIAALIVLVYTYAGGLFSSAYTDIFQIYLAIGAFWAAFLFFAGGFYGVDFGTILGNAPPAYLDLSGLVDPANGAYVNWASIMALGLGDIVALDFMERVFAARDGRTAQRGAFMGAGLTLFTVIPTSMMGIIALFVLPNIADPFTAYPELAINHMPFPIGAALMMGVLGASMSTANGGLLAISSVMSRNIIQRDILRRMLKRPGMEDKKLLMTTRLFTIPMMVAAFILGYLLPQPGIYLVLAFDIVFAGAWAPLTLGLFWKKANMPAAITSLIVGSSIRLLLFLTMPPDLAGLDTMIPPPISFAAFVIVALATQKRYPGAQRHGVIEYVPPEEDVVKGEDLKGYMEPVGR
ncbi:Na+/proline symporter [Candidatus Nitrososphaera evergladensis SR1]|uniref:Na+/proline symporter n=1 Tax=Candidatus Nitrososphaera evergladensis SR1 TaxID=1459636 RepID=A0A075MWA9_9ARCH|nr:sodium:solute symporter family protein [Candidatus Nitrososphaera evergladensis]AIF84942.1 Na+/proline symporter [Candidatus Nitrososphaera evergladensis SR1]